MSEFKTGDRVEIIGEFAVTQAKPTSDGRIRVSVPGDRNQFAWVRPEHLKLVVPPEPQWVRGDVVRVRGVVDLTYTYDEGRRHARHATAADGQISACWRDGQVEILHKADA